MSDQGIFNTPEQEVKRLASEIREMRTALQELSLKLTRIETRMSRAFPSISFRNKLAERAPRSILARREPSLTVEQALKLYENLVAEAKKTGTESIQQRLSGMDVADLSLLRRELGISLGKKKSSSKVLTRLILGRINESILLSKHVDRLGTTGNHEGDSVGKASGSDMRLE